MPGLLDADVFEERGAEGGELLLRRLRQFDLFDQRPVTDLGLPLRELAGDVAEGALAQGLADRDPRPGPICVGRPRPYPVRRLDVLPRDHARCPRPKPPGCRKWVNERSPLALPPGGWARPASAGPGYRADAVFSARTFVTRRTPAFAAAVRTIRYCRTSAPTYSAATSLLPIRTNPPSPKMTTNRALRLA